ncbi:MAG: GAF domain-containing protein [Acidobacteriota bacterium]
MTEPLDLDLFAASPPDSEQSAAKSDRQMLTTLFALGREVSSVLDLDELFGKLPDLISRVTDYHAFAVYLLDEERGDLHIAFATGYPEGAKQLRLKRGQGLVGAAVEAARPLLANDVTTDSRYIEAVPGTRAELVLPLRRKGHTIGALNLLSRNVGEFTPAEVETLRNFASAAAVAIENARLFATERRYADTLEALEQIGRDFASTLDLDELLKRIARTIKRIIDYRTFGILIVDDEANVVELRHAVKYDEQILQKRIPIGEGLVGYAARHKTPVLVGDVREDPRYIKVVEDVRSELVIPLLVKDRCVGLFDLESPELNAFNKRHVELLTPLAASAAVAVENARLYEQVRRNEVRLEKEMRFAQRVQQALLPTALPKRLKGVDVGWRFEPARELGGDLYEFLSLEPHTLTIAVGDVSGKGTPAALYSAYVGELLRSRAFRRRISTGAPNPADVLASMNRLMHERGLEEYFCTLLYAQFDLRNRKVTLANSGLPYPIHCTGDACRQIECPGVPLGTFPESEYEDLIVGLGVGDVFASFSDGVFEAMNAEGEEFGAERLMAAIRASRTRTAREIVDAVFEEAFAFRGAAAQNDDMTAVVVKITA